MRDVQNVVSLINESMESLENKKKEYESLQHGFERELQFLSAESTLSEDSREKLSAFIEQGINVTSKNIESVIDFKISLQQVVLVISSQTSGETCAKRLIEITLKGIRQLNSQSLKKVIINLERVCDNID